MNFRRWADAVMLATGWRRAWIAMLSGALGALALPPVGFFPAMFVPMTVAVWLLDGAGARFPDERALSLSRLRSAFSAGWLIGFGYFVAGLWWLGEAFLVEADKFAWALPLGVLGLPALLAFFPAFGFVVASLLWRPGLARIFALAFGLGLSELARGHLFTGFPWNAYGMALGQWLPLAQIASMIGLYGLTILAVFIFALPALRVDEPGRALTLRLPLTAAGVFLAALAAFGAIRLTTGEVGMTPAVRLRLMQPNIAQGAKLHATPGQDLLRSYLELSDRATSPQTAGLANATVLVWPESPFPFALNREPQALSMIASALAGRTTLLTGAVRVEGERGDLRAYNSLMAIGPDGHIAATYDKTHLVPFGEYLPAARFLSMLGLRQFVSAPAGFRAGTLRRAIALPGLPPFEPLICYEAIFPGEVGPQGESGQTARPAFLLNITNDAWFGSSAGPYQHFAQARLRSIEEGLPLVRAANTGISAVIDPYGRIVRQLPLGVAGVIDSLLPKPGPATLFSGRPWAATLVMLGACFVMSFLHRRKAY
ncbi:MAG: apolipoprotein N-acyltransferase [Hyphomicrobiales bacterium]|nr:apolipoprotein N-acyltransferase [Hyphomicrobiales bacterium]